ncbi:MAG: glycine cleavage system aminomethyltransferase GcvT [Elusimicrobia bacterium]|nr:glycine cleavage system aminomethyltransferase GcvT [Elusimicrobiota bacterium]
MQTETLRRTPLYEQMLKQGGKMVDFHGWELPVQFGGIIEEHKAVRNACGMFDVSHMGQIFVDGPQAHAFLQKVNANDIKDLPGRGVYSHVLNEKGGLVDDVIAFCRAKDSFLVVVNSATTDKDFAWFRKQAAGMDVKLQNKSDDYAMLAVQGPQAVEILESLFPGTKQTPRFGIMETKWQGQHVFLTRTGYTGEDGAEVMLAPALSASLWDALLAKGVKPCGLGSRDVLRLEAGYLLYGQDVDDDHTSYEANYGWVVKLKKDSFIGKPVVEAQKRDGIKTKLTGFVLTQGGVPRPGCGIYRGGVKIGSLNSATFSPFVGKGIGVGYVPPDLKEGDPVEIEIHSRRIAAKVSRVPFYNNKV